MFIKDWYFHLGMANISTNPSLFFPVLFICPFSKHWALYEGVISGLGVAVVKMMWHGLRLYQTSGRISWNWIEEALGQWSADKKNFYLWFIVGSVLPSTRLWERRTLLIITYSMKWGKSFSNILRFRFLIYYLGIVIWITLGIWWKEMDQFLLSWGI